MIDFLKQPWPWYVAGPLISVVLFLLLYWGKTFGVSGNYRTICSMVGLGRKSSFFDFDWRKEKWNLVFITGTLVGAAIVHLFFPNPSVAISAETVSDLESLGLTVDDELVPMELFAIERITELRTIILVVIGGLFIGFGTRYAGGCTSGHAITGLSDLQLPSLIAVIGFFIGGLLMTHVLFPFILNL